MFFLFRREKIDLSLVAEGTLVLFGATLYQMGTDDCADGFLDLPLQRKTESREGLGVRG